MSIPIVFGGVHPTLCPEEVLNEKCVDFVIVGEGEGAICDFVNNFYDKEVLFEISNLWSKADGKIITNKIRPLIKDLDCLPFPDKDMFYKVIPYSSNNYMIITSRGCPHGCTFCCNDSLKKVYDTGQRFVRRRSPGNVIAELEWAEKTYFIRHVFFDDNTFTYDKKWLREFSQLYKKNINTPCFCWVHPTEIDEEIVVYLKEMNCKAVEMGVESLNPLIREKWLHRYYTNEQIERALQLFKKNKIFCITDNIVGLPEETFSDLEYMVDFYNRNRPGKIYIFELRPFPNTKMAKWEKQEKLESVKRGFLPFTLFTKQNNDSKKIILLILAIYFLPQKTINFLLKRRIYKFFLPFYNYNLLYYLLESMLFLKNRLITQSQWFSVQRAQNRYPFFARKLISNYFRIN